MRSDRAGGRPDVRLRDVEEADLATLFAHQADPVAAELAAFPSRDRDAFFAHWRRILADPAASHAAVVADGLVVGNVVSWDGDEGREIGYWIGREHWGRGIGRRAVELYLDSERVRPLRAFVAEHNVASIRLLEKCGFVRRPGPAPVEGGVRFVVLGLA